MSGTEDTDPNDFWCPKCKSYENFYTTETRHMGNQAQPWVYKTNYHCCVCNAKGGFPSLGKDHMLGQLWWSGGMSLLWFLIFVGIIDSMLSALYIGGFALAIGLIWFAVACCSELFFMIRWKLWELRSRDR